MQSAMKEDPQDQTIAARQNSGAAATDLMSLSAPPPGHAPAQPTHQPEQRKHPPWPHHLTCAVKGCGAGLSSPYNRRCRMCAACMRSEKLLLGTDEGLSGWVRFCQRCHKVHVLSMFEGNKHSCWVALNKFNSHRKDVRRKRWLDAADAKEEDSAEEDRLLRAEDGPTQPGLLQAGLPPPPLPSFGGAAVMHPYATPPAPAPAPQPREGSALLTLTRVLAASDEASLAWNVLGSGAGAVFLPESSRSVHVRVSQTRAAPSLPSPTALAAAINASLAVGGSLTGVVLRP
jgi:hypothetical protein